MGKINYIIWALEFCCITAIGIILSVSNWSKYWIIVPITIILGLKIYECVAAVAEKHLRVKVQLELVYKLLSYETADDVKCTYHVPVWRNKLLQTCGYIPSGERGGRKFPRNKGIIGKAFIEKKILVENFKDSEEYRKQMVLKYNYTTEEVMQRSTDRRSYFCYPLLDESHRVLGLIYLDSKTHNLFTLDEDNHKVKMIEDACEKIKDSIL